MELREFKNDVKAVVDYLAQSGIEVQHTVMMEALSRGFGERTWSAHREALNSLKPAGPAREPTGSVNPLETSPWQPGNGPMTQGQYLAVKGMCCPSCGSRDIESDAVDADGPEGSADARCHACDASWHDLWAISGYDDLNAPEASPVLSPAPEPAHHKRVSGELLAKWDGRNYITGSATLVVNSGQVTDIKLTRDHFPYFDNRFIVIEEAGTSLRLALENRNHEYFVSPEGLTQVRKLLKLDDVVDKQSGLTLAELYTAVKGELVQVSDKGIEFRTTGKCLLETGCLLDMQSPPDVPADVVIAAQ